MEGGRTAGFDATGAAGAAVGTDTNPTRKPRFWVYALVVAVFLGYAAWMLGPYLRSVIVRDAAVTAWKNVATAPIRGVVQIDRNLVGQIVGSDGVVLSIRDDRAAQLDVHEAQIRVDLEQAKVAQLQDYINDIGELDADRKYLQSRYAYAFRDQIDAEIKNLQSHSEIVEERLSLMKTIAERSAELARRGSGSLNSADEAAMRVSDLALELNKLQSDLDYARVRRAAVDQGVFITITGEDTGWYQATRLELKLEEKKARIEKVETEAELGSASAALASARQEFALQREAAVTAAAGSIIWSDLVAPGKLVSAGEPVFEWVDCSDLMIDVPVSDAEVSLINPGMDAHVILEGESEIRATRVLLTRGSTSTLGVHDLAAVAKGRHDGVAQVLLKFEQAQQFEACPVGRAAYVDFPDVGLIDVIKARLRL
jgi:multidrug resistance efflux pump